VEIVREAYPDPTDPTGRFLAVVVKATTPMQAPVSLASTKADLRLKSMVLVTNTRLSVQPVTDREWEVVCALGGVRA
jgi:predicted RNA-binding protein with PUA-like domain